MARIWRAHVAGFVASLADIWAPVTLESRGTSGSRSVKRDMNAENSGITGSINREWNACAVRTRRATMPFSARRAWKSRMLSSDPATTQLPGSLIAARSTSDDEVLCDGFRAQGNRHHDTARRCMHQASAHRYRLDRRPQIEDAGKSGRRVLADAVTGQHRPHEHRRTRSTSPTRIPRRTARAAPGRCVRGCVRPRRTPPRAGRSPAPHRTLRRSHRSAPRIPVRLRAGRAPSRCAAHPDPETGKRLGRR